MRYLLFLAVCSVWGQEIAVNYTTVSGTSGGVGQVLNGADDGYGLIFTAPTATSVSGVSVYASAVGTANVDTLRVQIQEMMGTFPAAVVTYTDASDLVNLANNVLSNGDVLRFSTATTLPAGISATTDYYVCSTTSSTFQIDDSVGCGSVVTDFSGSSGAQYAMKIVATSTTFSPSPATASSWIDFSTFSAHTLVAGRKYIAMVLNTEAVPATDTITIMHMFGEYPQLGAYWQGGAPGSVVATAAKGAATTPSVAPTGYVTLASGYISGSAVYGSELSSNMRVNGTRRIGSKFTTPANVKYNIWGLGMQVRSASNNFPKSMDLELYAVGASTDTLVSSCTATAPQYAVAVTGWTCALSSATALSASTVYRLAATATSAAGDSSNYLSITGWLRRASTSFDNTLAVQATYCAATCTTTANWTDETNKSAPFMLLLDSTTPYATQSSGTTGCSFVVTQ